MRNCEIGFRRIYNALIFSLHGLLAAYRSEAAFRQEVLVCLLLTPIVVLVEFTSIERILLIVSLLLVLIVEVINSAIEATIERISPDIHPLSKKAKDLGSASVFLSILLALIVWSTICWRFILLVI